MPEHTLDERVRARWADGPARWPGTAATRLADALERTERSVVLALGLARVEGPRPLLDAVRPALLRALTDTWPAWLPGAEGVAGPGGAGTEAVRVLARRRAAAGAGFGPFLEAAAAAAIADRTVDASAWPGETLVGEAVRLLLDAYGREGLHVVCSLAPGLDDAARRAIAADARWLADRPHVVPWLATAHDEPLPGLPCVTVPGPETAPSAAPEAPRLTPLSGRPAPLSHAEHRLEAALAHCSWARDREWNRGWRPGPLAGTIHVDVMWLRQRLAVELDGGDHREAEKYAADRRRDRLLQHHGFAVLRFTNEEVVEDPARVVEEIRRMLATREGTAEGVVT